MMKRNKCRELLHDFYYAWYMWALDKAEYPLEPDPADAVLKPDYGLCTNLLRYVEQMRGFSKAEAVEVLAMLHQDLKDAGFKNTVIPFNHDSDEYWRESQLGMHHLNSERLEWVREQIELHDEEMARRVDL